MEKEEQLFRKRIQELAENAYSRDIPLHTDFLTLEEKSCVFWHPMRLSFTRRLLSV